MALTDKLTAIADAIRDKTGVTAPITLDQMAALVKTIDTALIEDVPTTLGQWACLARASQMRDIKYTPKADMYSSGSESWEAMQAGTEYTGLVYSSVRGLDWGFIGFPISMYSYLTALNNPKSFVYTKRYEDYFTAINGDDPTGSVYANVYNVYGTNCSEFVSYSLDLPYLLTTMVWWNDYPYMVDDNGRNDIYFTGNYGIKYRAGKCCNAETGVVNTEALQTKLKLCDVMFCTNHTVMVTGIRRDSHGLIQEVDISESLMPRIKSTTYSWDRFVEEYIDIDTAQYPYQVFEYTKLDSVSFPENLNDIVYSDIVTNRGDKICIRPDQDIALNVLSGGYAGIVLFKDGVQVTTQASTDDWELTNLTTGKYTAILYKSGETVTIDDANETNSTSFIVCAVSLAQSGNTYTYTAEAVNGVYPKPMQVALKTAIGMTDQVGFIEDDNFNGSGSIEIVPRKTPVLLHCPFKTEYGFVIAECQYSN